MRKATIVSVVLGPLLLASTASSQPATSSAQGEARIIRGTYSSRGGTSFFTPCGSKTRLRASDETPDGSVTAMYADISRDNPSGQVFTEVSGIKTAQAVRILSVEKMYRDGPGCKEDLSGIVWKGRGYEPAFWLEADALSVRFQPMSESSPLQFESGGILEEGASRVLSAESSAGKILVRILPHRCKDDLTGGIYSWRMEITFGDQKFTGCAYPGDVRR
ncbi:MAG: hypothetical protein IT186_24710 [Acidobacteria bacterium]|nr:hypothetical protein [Acidobacteriota bacterium]MCK6681281.1 hypothetical protein [Thermoanaerobaculia bacterium]